MRALPIAILTCWVNYHADDGADIKKKTTKLSGVEVGHGSHLDTANGEFTKKINTVVGQIVSTPNPDGSFTSKELMTRESKEVILITYWVKVLACIWTWIILGDEMIDHCYHPLAKVLSEMNI